MIRNTLPVVCFDMREQGDSVNDKVRLKISLSNPKQSFTDFAEKIEYLYNHKDYLQNLSDRCKERQQELSWNNKALKIVELYKSIKNE